MMAKMLALVDMNSLFFDYYIQYSVGDSKLQTLKSCLQAKPLNDSRIAGEFDSGVQRVPSSYYR